MSLPNRKLEIIPERGDAPKAPLPFIFGKDELFQDRFELKISLRIL